MSYPIIVFISGNGSNLQAIINAIEAGQLPATIAAVISDKADAYGVTRAKNAGISTHIVAKQNNESREDYDRRLLATIAPYQPRLIVLAGFMRILSATFVDAYPCQIINIHPSLLPKYPGLNTHAQVLANGDQYHGISIHFVTAKLDAGPLIAQSQLTIKPGEPEEALVERIHQLEHQIYPLVISWFANGRISSDGNTIYLDNHPLKAQGNVIFFEGCSTANYY